MAAVDAATLMGLPWRPRAALCGSLAGLAGMMLFFTLHHVLVQPIWAKGLLRGVAVAVLGGGTMGLLYDHMHPSLPVESRWRGVWFGALVALFLAPFLFAGYARIHGASAWTVAPLLVAMLALVLWAYLEGTRIEEEPRGRATARRAALFLIATAALNAVPALFLLDLVTIVDDHVPDPFPMASVLAASYVLAGAIVGRFVPVQARAR